MSRLMQSTAAALVLAFLAAAPAAAQTCVAPPGTAAVDQYCETVPSAGGDRGAGGSAPRAASPTPTPAAAVVPPGTASTIAKAGKDGAALNRLLGQDHAGRRGRSGSATATAPSGPTGAAAAPSPSGNPLDAIRRSLSDGSTAGSPFVWVLLLSALGMAGWGWTAFRRRRTA
jgi:hypothetical protein